MFPEKLPPPPQGHAHGASPGSDQDESHSAKDPNSSIDGGKAYSANNLAGELGSLEVTAGLRRFATLMKKLGAASMLAEGGIDPDELFGRELTADLHPNTSQTRSTETAGAPDVGSERGARQNRSLIVEEAPPIAISILGAPGGGKGYLKTLLLSVAREIGDSRVVTAISEGENLAIDELRKEVQSRDPQEQLVLFLKAYDYIHTKYPGIDRYLSGVKEAWKKIDAASEMITTGVAEDGRLLVNGRSEVKEVADLLRALSPEESGKIVASLHSYLDFRGVVKAFQAQLEEQAILRGDDLLYDESGVDSTTILRTLHSLRQNENPYVSLVFIVHGKSAATNLLQNAARMVIGSDDGRDSSTSICDAWAKIQAALDEYQRSAEVIRRISSSQSDATSLMKEEMSFANTEDNTSQYAADLLTVVETADPAKAYERIVRELSKSEDPLAMKFFKAILHFQIIHLKAMDDTARKVISDLVGPPMSNEDLRGILSEVKRSGRFSHRLNNLGQMLKLTDESGV
jgi:hypothetical protein